MKYGKITEHEVKMNTYEADTSAAAVVLFEEKFVRFDFSAHKGFAQVTDYSTKIKILKEEGLEQANISIPYHDYSYDLKEIIEKLQGTVYNWENGSIKKTKLDKKYIFVEKVSKNLLQKKFTFPDVKVGSVIEYKYSVRSDFYWLISDINTQKSIPVWHSEATVEIPEYFDFSVNAYGWQLPQAEIIPSYQNFMINTGHEIAQIKANTKIYKIVTDTAQALKPESHIWCLEDFRPRLSFELKGTMMPGSTYKRFTNSWEDIEENMMKFDDFGDMLKIGCPFKDEAALLSSIPDTTERADAVLQLVKNKISWNENYALWASDIKEAVKNGKGNNAQINFILISALKAAGLKAYPVVLSRRNLGRLPFTFPTMEKLNTFIVAVDKGNNEFIYMDGGSRYGGINLLDESLLVEQARLMGPKISRWVNLRELCKNIRYISIQASIDKTGLISGKMTTICNGQSAYSQRKWTASASDKEEIKTLAEKDYDLEISEYESGKGDKDNTEKEELTFSKQLSATDEFIYINPIVFNYMSESPFNSPTRKYPVEFPYNIKTIITTTITIPEGYKITELPEKITMITADKSIRCNYSIITDGNTITLQYNLDRRKSYYLQDKYPDLQNFYSALIGKCNEQIVLQKL